MEEKGWKRKGREETYGEQRLYGETGAIEAIWETKAIWGNRDYIEK